VTEHLVEMVQYSSTFDVRIDENFSANVGVICEKLGLEGRARYELYANH